MIHTPQPLCYNWATCANKETISKLRGTYGRLNLLSKPMQMFSIDETSVFVVGKVVAEVDQRVCSVTSAERGKLVQYIVTYV